MAEEPDWKENTRKELERWRDDPNYISIMPVTDFVAAEHLKEMKMGEHKQREERLVALESRVGRLEQVSDINAEAFSSSLQFAEMCIQAVQRVLDDSLSGTIKTMEIDGAKKVDFKAYLQDVLDVRMVSEKVETGMAPESALRPSDGVAFEFGG